MFKVYLCGPIANCSDGEAKNWREWVKENIVHQTIDPMRRDYRGNESDNYREIVDLDKKDIRNSDLLLVNYPKPSVGTSMEILFAWSLGKPIIIVDSSESPISPWLRYHSTFITRSWVESVASINSYLN